MANYACANATNTWVAMPAPAADAWLQPIGWDVYISTDATPNVATAGVLTDRTGYPVSSGQVVRVRAMADVSVPMRMWDR